MKNEYKQFNVNNLKNYLSEIRKYKLLSFEEQIHLAKKKKTVIKNHLMNW